MKFVMSETKDAFYTRVYFLEYVVKMVCRKYEHHFANIWWSGRGNMKVRYLTCFVNNHFILEACKISDTKQVLLYVITKCTYALFIIYKRRMVAKIIFCIIIKKKTKRKKATQTMNSYYYHYYYVR